MADPDFKLAQWRKIFVLKRRCHLKPRRRCWYRNSRNASMNALQRHMRSPEIIQYPPSSSELTFSCSLLALNCTFHLCYKSFRSASIMEKSSFGDEEAPFLPSLRPISPKKSTWRTTYLLSLVLAVSLFFHLLVFMKWSFQDLDEICSLYTSQASQ